MCVYTKPENKACALLDCFYTRLLLSFSAWFEIRDIQAKETVVTSLFKLTLGCPMPHKQGNNQYIIIKSEAPRMRFKNNNEVQAASQNSCQNSEHGDPF